jgi:O-antigen/teichoic acid export membrane protein
MPIRHFKKAIKTGGKIVGSDAGYIARGGAWLFATQVVTALVSFGSALLFARLTDAETYGMYKYAIAASAVVASFSLTGLSTAIVQSVARGYEGLYKNAFRMSMRFSVPIVLISICAIAYYLFNNNITLAMVWAVIGITTPLATSSSFYVSYLNGTKRYGGVFAAQAIRSIVPTGAVVALLLFQAPVWMLVLAFLGGVALTNMSLHTMVSWWLPPNNTIDRVSLNYAKHLSIMGILSGFSTRFDSLLIFHFLGATPLAIYSFATAIPDQIIGLSKHVSTLALPKFSTHGKEVVQKTFFKKVILMGITGGIFAGLYILITPYIFTFLFPAYMESVPLSQLFAINIALAFAGALYGTYFDAQTEARIKYFLITFNNVIRITLMLILTVPFGLVGIMLGEIFSRCISLIVMSIVVRRQ